MDYLILQVDADQFSNDVDSFIASGDNFLSFAFVLVSSILLYSICRYILYKFL
jgi:hypothetical protein